MDDPAHRRIELQSPEDLTYLIDNVRKAAADSINAAFPPVDNPLDGQEDELRNHIEQLVNDYIFRTFTIASPSLSINGLPITDPTTFLSSLSRQEGEQYLSAEGQPQVRYEYEPFDGRKRDRMEQLISEEEDLLRAIATLKRRAPAAAAGRWAQATETQLATDDAALEAARQRAVEEGAEGGAKTLEGMGPLERQEGVEERFSQAVAGLGRLKRDMPATVAKMERARVAGEYVTRDHDGGGDKL
ncbi:uncharacterized protein C8A04DRAFT_29240 [Dichotomopilus funicola]|uniref:Kinetochore protein mis14 n=1 Tax=Dichotomopilus funicola TaxID=1934379 RepID=A0AAN6ZKW2_9PEZI|nr:hypothetical protein C8A04DRAFT_29240 [Dichotomopilus funicola]